MTSATRGCGCCSAGRARNPAGSRGAGCAPPTLAPPGCEAQFTALRYVTLDGTDHATHNEQASMIRRYIIWRNNHACDERLRRIVNRANVA